jgi:hypothetical protein
LHVAYQSLTRAEREHELDADVYGRSSMLDRRSVSITHTRSFQNVIVLGNFVAHR